jgi:valyl-tRNA synthetase
MDKRFDFKQSEPKIYEKWEKGGYFNPDKLPGERLKKFTVVIPPPNITGALHIGHALNSSVQDAVIRHKRMQGYRTLWLPGFDHAGIATQSVIEKKILKEQNLSRHDLGREKFISTIWTWKDDYQRVITNQLKKIGASCDWSRTRFTLDENYSQSVQAAFKHYYEKGWIYRKEKIINWCPRCGTALSELELDHKAEKTHLWYIRYPLESKGYITIATTRPETILGDLAIAVNPEDKRYQKLIGQKAIVPVAGHVIPIITDQEIDPEFGTGALKVTPSHDPIDAEIGERHQLGLKNIIGPDGRMNDLVPEEYKGLSISAARNKIVEHLTKEGLLEKTEEYQHDIPVCERCQNKIEAIPSEQWFLKMEHLAQLAAQPIKEGKIKFYPARWEKVYLAWLANIRDWCLSRQIWWGHPVPMEGEKDVLDTWFSSALWPFAVMGWPEETDDLSKFFPTDFLATAVDIMNLWVARMIFSSLEFTQKVPFSRVYFHPTILNKKGQRMSKSLGTGIDPLELIEKYGADATRFGLLWQTGSNRQDIRFGEEDIIMGQKFTTKLWNATRFIIAQSEKYNLGSIDLNNIDSKEEIIQKLKLLIDQVNESLDQYRFDQATQSIYHFFWHEFCDQYLETAKEKISHSEEPSKIIANLFYILSTIIKILHPFMPFITEELYQMIPLKDKKDSLIIENWPN